MGFSFKRTGVKLDDLTIIGSFLVDCGHGRYTQGVFDAITQGCFNEDKKRALVNIRINSSSPGPRWHIDGIPQDIEDVTSCTKYAITLEGPGTLLLGEELTDEVYQRAIELQRELSSKYGNTTEEKRIQKILNKIFEGISTRQADVGELISRTGN